MNAFQVILTPEVQAVIRRLDPVFQTSVLNKLEWIGQNAELLHGPRRVVVRRMSGAGAQDMAPLK